MSAAQPDRILYGIGAQKAATTWLFAQFEKHADVHVALPKELHYWDTIRAPYTTHFGQLADVRHANATRLERLGPVGRLINRTPAVARADAAAWRDLLRAESPGHARYLAYLGRGAAPAAKVWADVTPAYALCSAATFAEMAGLHPQTRFVYILRDPVERLISGLRQTFRAQIVKGQINQAAFDRAFDEAVDMQGAHPAFQRSDYAMTLRNLDRAVPASDVLVLFYETMFTEAEMARLAAFAGIAPLGADFKTQVYKGPDASLRPDAARLAAARAALAPVYDDVAARFGDAVPASWMRDG